MIKTVFAESADGVHRCEAASGLDTYLPCPYPRCKKGIDAKRIYVPIPDDHAYSASYSQPLSDGPVITVEIYERVVIGNMIGKSYKWSFIGEETR